MSNNRWIGTPGNNCGQIPPGTQYPPHQQYPQPPVVVQPYPQPPVVVPPCQQPPVVVVQPPAHHHYDDPTDPIFWQHSLFGGHKHHHGYGNNHCHSHGHNKFKF